VRGRWTIRYYDEDGVQRERVTKARSKRDALTHLREALNEVEKGRGRSPIRTMAELYAFHRRQRQVLQKSTEDLDKRWKQLGPRFGTVDVNGVNSTMLDGYVEHRTLEGVIKSTINRELATVRHLLRVGAQATPPIVRWDKIPAIKLADESDLIRTVFIDDDVWAQLRQHLAPHLRPLFTLAYWIGWRRGELLGLQRSQLDLKRGTVRLQPGRTKNKEGRLVYLPAEALAVLREQERRTRQLERTEQRVIPWVFHYRGERFTSYYKGWYRACERAGFRKGELRPHDFRRTASRAYTRAGVSEQIVMKITGHKTRAMFDRYNITAEPDLAEAAVR
jgi:integrase